MSWFIIIPSGELTWQWDIPIFNRTYIFKLSIFHCYVSLLEGNPHITWVVFHPLYIPDQQLGALLFIAHSFESRKTLSRVSQLDVTPPEIAGLIKGL